MEEIWKWTMTSDAVATCFVRDVFDMRENLEGGVCVFDSYHGRSDVILTKMSPLFSQARIFTG